MMRLTNMYIQRKRSDALLSYHPIEIARQCTLLISELLRNIPRHECLDGGWNKKGKNQLAPNIVAMIENFNQASLGCSHK